MPHLCSAILTASLSGRDMQKRPRLSRSERLALLLACLRMKQQPVLNALLIVKPATLAGWHWQIVRRHWTFNQKRKPGRARIDPDAEKLVVQVARENLGRGYTKIAGEVRKRGCPTIGDRDSKFTAPVDGLLRAMGTKPVLLPPRSPDLNGRAERSIRTARDACLDHIIILNERHLRWALGE